MTGTLRLANVDRPGRTGLGIVDGDEVLDVAVARRELGAGLPDCLSAALSLGTSVLEELLAATTALVAAARAARGPDWAREVGLVSPLGAVRLAAPVGAHAAIFCVGLNYRSHAAEAGMEIPKYPMIFMKPVGALGGTQSPVRLPAVSRRVDYEGEIAVIIGSRLHAATAEQAEQAIAGYALANDVSARDWQFRTTELMLGKAFDTFCPIGPWLTPARSVDDPAGIEFTTTVNGERRQQGRADDMIFPLAEIVAYISQVSTLSPGDVILTGTPGGIGAAASPRTWLRAGDRVTVDSPQLGTLSNPFVRLDGGDA